MLVMTTPVVLQVSGTNNPDEVLTAMRELPESTARDQDHLVPLVAEVVMLSKHGTLNITFSLYSLVIHSKFGVAACVPSCDCSFVKILSGHARNTPLCRHCHLTVTDCCLIAC